MCIKYLDERNHPPVSLSNWWISITCKEGLFKFWLINVLSVTVTSSGVHVGIFVVFVF